MVAARRAKRGVLAGIPAVLVAVGLAAQKGGKECSKEHPELLR